MLWAPWRLEGAALEEGKRDAVLLALREQEQAGIDIVTDGEQTRRHFVWGFVERLDGIDFSKMVTIGIRADRYDATVPTVIGPVRRRGSIHGDDVRCCARQHRRRLKFTMPGPMTIVDTIHDGHYGSRGEARDGPCAEILNEEARELEALGVDMIQLDEPAFNVYMDEVRDWGVAALDRAVEGLRCRPRCTSATATASRPTPTGRRPWAASGGSTSRPSRSWPRAASAGCRSSARNSRVPIELIGLLGDKDVLVGAIDVATDRVETPEEVAAVIRSAMQHVPAARIFPCTNCGMVPLSRGVARGKLRALGAGAAIVRRELAG